MRARAALFSSTRLFLVQHSVHHLNERGVRTSATARSGVDARASIGSLSNGHLGGGGHGARAALGSFLSLASRSLTLQLTLGLGTVDGLDALVLAVQSLTHGSTLGFRSHAGGVATSRLADSLALRATILLTQLLGATNSADRAFAVNSALGAGHLLALHLTLRTSADRVADSRAGRVVTLPLAHGVALFSSGKSQQEAHSDKEDSLHGCLVCCLLEREMCVFCVVR